MIKCEGCNHKKVCVFKDKYNKISENIKKAFNFEETPFNTRLVCKHYDNNGPSIQTELERGSVAHLNSKEA